MNEQQRTAFENREPSHKEDPLLTLQEVARYVGKHRNTVKKWVETGVLRARKLPPVGGVPHVRQSDLNRFLDGSALEVGPITATEDELGRAFISDNGTHGKSIPELKNAKALQRPELLGGKPARLPKGYRLVHGHPARVGENDARERVYYCSSCEGYVTGHPEPRLIGQTRLATVTNQRRGKTYHCRLCGYEVGFQPDEAEEPLKRGD